MAKNPHEHCDSPECRLRPEDPKICCCPCIDCCLSEGFEQGKAAVTKTLRDEFAIAAFAHILLRENEDCTTVEDDASEAYAFADAMLSVRGGDEQ